jgi:hypothetical protein
MTEQDPATTEGGTSTATTGLSTADLASASQGSTPVASAGDTQVETRSTVSETETQGSGGATALFPSDETSSFQSRWQDIQSAFVDDPQAAVKQADSLVAECMQRLADLFATERSNLEDQWSSGGDVSTEDLRIAFQRYRSFFDRLLSV